MIKQIFTLIKIIIVSLCIYFFYELLCENINEIPALNTSKPLYLIFLTSLFTLNSLLLSFSWHMILNGYGIKSSYIKSSVFYHLTQFGKYFPGNFGHYISRAYYSNKINTSVFEIINFIYLESYWLLCAAILSSYFIDLTLVFNGDYLSFLNYFSVKFVLFIISICLFIYLNRKTIQFLSKINLLSLNKIFNKNLSLLNHFIILTSYILYFAVSSLLLMLFVNEALNYSDFSYYNFLGIVSLSWIIGFIIPGAPAGLGVREYSLVLMLSLIMPISISISCSILFRLFSLFSDALLFCSAFALNKFLKN